MPSEWHQALGFLDPRMPGPSRSASLRGNNPALVYVNINEFLLRFVVRDYVLCCSGEREFKATLVIWSPLVKTTLTLQLQGTGSFNEVHRKDHLT